MNVLGISGSFRHKSNSHILLQHALQPFEETGWDVTLIRLRGLTVKPCDACEYCRTHDSDCRIDDDMHRFYGAFRQCDALIVASPVYFRNICAQVMAVFNRFHAIFPERSLEGKVGGAIAVGAGGGGGQAITISAIYNWMLSCGMICVPGELNGVTAVARDEGEVLEQKQRLVQARLLGEKVLDISVRLRTDPDAPVDSDKM